MSRRAHRAALIGLEVHTCLHAMRTYSAHATRQCEHSFHILPKLTVPTRFCRRLVSTELECFPGEIIQLRDGYHQVRYDDGDLLWHDLRSSELTDWRIEQREADMDAQLLRSDKSATGFLGVFHCPHYHSGNARKKCFRAYHQGTNFGYFCTAKQAAAAVTQFVFEKARLSTSQAKNGGEAGEDNDESAEIAPALAVALDDHTMVEAEAVTEKAVVAEHLGFKLHLRCELTHVAVRRAISHAPRGAHCGTRARTHARCGETGGVFPSMTLLECCAIDPSALHSVPRHSTRHRCSSRVFDGCYCLCAALSLAMVTWA